MTRRIAVEAHGDQHQDYSEFFHGTREGLLNQVERDIRKSEWCEINDMALIEIYTDDLPLTEKWFWDNYELKL
jgi:hypothetical protein